MSVVVRLGAHAILRRRRQPPDARSIPDNGARWAPRARARSTWRGARASRSSCMNMRTTPDRRSRRAAAAMHSRRSTALGLDADRVFKTIVVSVDGRLGLAIVPADAEVDLKAAAGRARRAEGGDRRRRRRRSGRRATSSAGSRRWGRGGPADGARRVGHGLADDPRLGRPPRAGDRGQRRRPARPRDRPGQRGGRPQGCGRGARWSEGLDRRGGGGGARDGLRAGRDLAAGHEARPADGARLVRHRLAHDPCLGRPTRAGDRARAGGPRARSRRRSWPRSPAAERSGASVVVGRLPCGLSVARPWVARRSNRSAPATIGTARGPTEVRHRRVERPAFHLAPVPARWNGQRSSGFERERGSDS